MIPIMLDNRLKPAENIPILPIWFTAFSAESTVVSKGIGDGSIHQAEAAYFPTKCDTSFSFSKQISSSKSVSSTMD